LYFSQVVPEVEIAALQDITIRFVRKGAIIIVKPQMNQGFLIEVFIIKE